MIVADKYLVEDIETMLWCKGEDICELETDSVIMEFDDTVELCDIYHEYVPNIIREVLEHLKCEVLEKYFLRYDLLMPDYYFIVRVNNEIRTLGINVSIEDNQVILTYVVSFKGRPSEKILNTYYTRI